MWGAEGGSGLPEEICGSWDCQLRPQVPGNRSPPLPAARGWRGLGAAGLGHPWAEKGGTEPGPLLQVLTQPGPPPWAPPWPSQPSRAAKADGAVVAAVPVLSPLPAEGYKPKIKIKKPQAFYTVIVPVLWFHHT